MPTSSKFPLRPSNIPKFPRLRRKNQVWDPSPAGALARLLLANLDLAPPLPYRWFSWKPPPWDTAACSQLEVWARLWAPTGTGEQAYHEQAWSVTLALATTKVMVGKPHSRAIKACEGHDQTTYPHACHAAAPSSWVALMACGRTGSGRRVVGCERSVSRTYPWFPMRHGNSVGSGALVIFIMHQTHDLAPFHGRGGQCVRAWDSAVS